MPDYKKMYLLLFNAITDALNNMSDDNYGAARDLLISSVRCWAEISKSLAAP